MIFDAAALPTPARIEAEVCVVGSGAGGAAAAMVAAEAGARVLVLEAGEFFTPADMSQREEEMLPRLFWDAGGRTNSDRSIKIHQGRGVGGSTLHNTNLCKRIPDSILARWRATRGLAHLGPEVWRALYDEVETMLAVAPIPREMWNTHNRLLEQGCAALGWRGGGLLHNRTGCVGSGFCELGCSYDAKNNAAKVMLPRALRAGAEIVTRCQAVRIRHDGKRVLGLDAVALDPETHQPRGLLTIDAPTVCLGASATGTAALLLRSKVPDPGGETGRRLRIHPGVAVAGVFDEEVAAWRGIPQTYECTELLDLDERGGHRLWIVPAFAHPVGVAVSLPGHGAIHRQLMQSYSHLAAFTAMLHDETAGVVRPDGDLQLGIDYTPNEADRRELGLGVAACARLLFAAGARRIILPGPRLRVLERGADLEALGREPIAPGGIDLTAVHPMGSVPMGDDARVAAIDSQGRHHHLQGLWVADGSLFPSSIGVPPQISIYALGLHVGRALAKRG